MRKFILYSMILVLIVIIFGYGFLKSSSTKNNLPALTVPETSVVNKIYEKFEKLETDLKDYIWPTDASTRITSTFAEYRSTHFHGGIDISTNKKNGYKVFAVRDGYIWRIRVQTNGYGKMLYVKHKDGFFTIYAHLQTFNERINKITRQEQYQQEIYAVDFTLDSTALPVKKGEVIAYTGDTGVGPPHLHFEIRDENLNPVNPLLFSNLNVQDNSPPVIKKIFIATSGINSKINENFTPFIFNNRNRGSPRYNRGSRAVDISSPIRSTGNIRFGIETIDIANKAANRSGVYAISLFLNDSLIYDMKFDRIPADESKQILMHYDLPLLREGIGKFQKLYVEEGTALPIYSQLPFGSGIIDTRKLKEGFHSFRISVKDFYGNESQLKGKLLVNYVPEIEIKDVSNDEIILSGRDLGIIDKLILQGKSKKSHEWIRHTMLKGIFSFDGTNIRIPVDLKPYTIIKITGENKYGLESLPVFYFSKEYGNAANYSINITKNYFQDFIELVVTTPGYFTNAPKLQFFEGNLVIEIPLKSLDINKYSGTYTPKEFYQGQRILKATAEIDGKLIEETEKFDLHPIPIDRAGEFFLADGKIKITYDSCAVFKPLIMYFDSTLREGTTIFSLQPQDVLLNKNIKITYTQKEKDDGLYFRFTGDWIYQQQDTNGDKTTLSGVMFRTLGDVAIFKDTQKPGIARLKIQTQNRKPIITFRYSDDLSGFDDKKLRMYIDGKLVIPEIDGEHRRIWYNSEQNLEKGLHTLKIVFADRAGNQDEINKMFRIR
ncbi:MAG: M23 family metallopeptidase [Bacteroidetes bacterium]|nr:M23 family metallopeptidase [Bacteroidota bacterium]